MTTLHLAPYTQAGDLVFLSGQLAFDERGSVAGDVGEQTRVCLERLAEALSPTGLTSRHIVKCTIWLRHQQDFQAFNAAYAEFFGEHRPARSTVISALALPSALVEIEAIASRSAAP